MSFAPRATDAIRRLTDPFHRLPIRTRLATVSTALTFVILCSFALIIGDLTVSRIRSDFRRDVEQSAQAVANQLGVDTTQEVPGLQPGILSGGTQLRIIAQDARTVLNQTRGAYALGSAPVIDANGSTITEETANGYLIENRPIQVASDGDQLYLQYARPLSQIDATVGRVRLLLLLGVLAGTGLALLGSLMVARRAMRPIARLTWTARQIAETRDPSLHVPEPETDDEIAELARTFDQMLRSLDAARGETEAALVRQRQFVADASHELRTPLTSVLANLELLADSLHGDEGEAAASALRSTQRMRRLVADLLMLARSDVARVAERQPVDLARVAVEAAAEIEPIAAGHRIELEAGPGVVLGVRDELFRLALNLIENAVKHTPAGTTITVRTGPGRDGEVELVVADDGPGVPAAIAPTLFERFVRGAGDRGGSFGLGLAIVKAVAESHGGGVALDTPSTAAGARPQPGARFVVRLPRATTPAHPDEAAVAPISAGAEYPPAAARF